MPSFNQYKKLAGGRTIGQQHKYLSDYVMEETWYNDIEHKTAYLYDWYHDSHKTQLNNMKPEKDLDKTPIEIKYIVASSQTFAKDAITYHIQMKPSQVCNVKYYDEFFGDKYDARFPNGLYIDIPDEKGIFNRWLVVATANGNDPQFPTFEILRCDKVVQWVHDGCKYNMAGVLRSQNSYNSGVWADYHTEVVEDQQKFILPLNEVSEHIYYNQRMIMDAFVQTQPRAWRISKVNRIASNGLGQYTLKQDFFDQHKDFIERDEDGKIIGMWADYYETDVEPEEYAEDVSGVVGKITYSGLPQIKVGGSYKKFTLSYYKYDEPMEVPDGAWVYTIDGEDATALLSVLTEGDVMKIKFLGDDSYMGKILTLRYVVPMYRNIDTEVEIVGL